MSLYIATATNQLCPKQCTALATSSKAGRWRVTSQCSSAWLVYTSEATLAWWYTCHPEKYCPKRGRKLWNPCKEKRKSCFISVPVLVALEAQGKASSTNIKLAEHTCPPHLSKRPGEVQDARFAMYTEFQIKLYSIQLFQTLYFHVALMAKGSYRVQTVKS